MNWWRLLGLLCVFVPWLLLGAVVHSVRVLKDLPTAELLAHEPTFILPVVTAGVRAADRPE